MSVVRVLADSGLSPTLVRILFISLLYLNRDCPLLELSGQSRWRAYDHPRTVKADRDKSPISVGRGENHTLLGKGGYFRFGPKT